MCGTCCYICRSSITSLSQRASIWIRLRSPFGVLWKRATILIPRYGHKAIFVELANGRDYD